MLFGKVFKIKEGKLDAWKAWCRELQTTYAAEGKKTLVEEGVEAEGFLIFIVGEDAYTLGFAYAPQEPKPANLENELNVLHRQKKLECLEAPAAGVDGGYFLSVEN